MNLNKRNIIFIPCIIFNLIQSCKRDFLETPPSLNVVRQEYVINLKSCQDLLNGQYIRLARDIFASFNHVYPDIVADNIKPYTGVSTFTPQYTWTQVANENRSNIPSASSVNMNALWTSGYGIIRDCNYLLENVDKFRNENLEMADNINAQALALRAVVHFYLVNVFAQPYKFSDEASHLGIPYVTVSDYKVPVSRQAVREVYDNIVNDLNASIPLLGNSTSPIIINRNFIKAFLARVYLFKGDYLNAKNLAKEVCGSVPIMQSPNYPSKLFTLQETEALFQLPPSNITYNTNFSSTAFRLTPNPTFVATNDIVQIINERPNDSRKIWVTALVSGWRITKFPVGVVSGFSNPNGAYYLTIMRSSEMYLTASEAFANLNKEDSARFFLDAIRKRADPTIIVSTASGQALVDSIYKERRKELAFEGMRMFDLLRTGKGVTRIDSPTPNAQNLSYPNPRAIAPIPYLDITLSGLPQNQSY